MDGGRDEAPDGQDVWDPVEGTDAFDEVRRRE